MTQGGLGSWWAQETDAQPSPASGLTDHKTPQGVGLHPRASFRRGH